MAAVLLWRQPTFFVFLPTFTLGLVPCMWLCHTYPSDRCRPMCCTVRGRDPHSSFCYAGCFSTHVLLQSKTFPVTINVFVLHSNDILQFDQPAVQHHLRVLHWGHLSSHDSLQHVSLQFSRLSQLKNSVFYDTMRGSQSSAGAFRARS